MRTKKDDQTPKVMKVSHIRRCHVCGTVNEAEGSAINKCGQCGKYLAPFYFFDENRLDGIADNGLHLSEIKNATLTHPIWGISTYWLAPEEDIEEDENIKDRHASKRRRRQKGA